MNNEPDFKIVIASERLSDNSHVYNVHFAGRSIPAVSREDAEALAAAMADAINYYSVADAKVMWGE